MIGWIVTLGYTVMVLTLAIVDPHPHFDMKRCYVVKADFARYCWPKNGCFYTSTDGDVLCWRVVTVTTTKRGRERP